MRANPQAPKVHEGIIPVRRHDAVNLPGTEGTVIIEAVPPGGDRALHFVRLKPAISPNVGASGAKFLVGGDCVRASPIFDNKNED